MYCCFSFDAYLFSAASMEAIYRSAIVCRLTYLEKQHLVKCISTVADRQDDGDTVAGGFVRYILVANRAGSESFTPKMEAMCLSETSVLLIITRVVISQKTTFFIEKSCSQLSTRFKGHSWRHSWRRVSHFPVQTKRDNFFEPALLRSKQIELQSLMTMDKCIVFLWFLNKGYTAILYSFPSSLVTSLYFPFIYAIINFVFKANFWVTNPDDLPQITPNWSEFTVIIIKFWFIYMQT
jgi:hypothetical protein